MGSLPERQGRGIKTITAEISSMMADFTEDSLIADLSEPWIFKTMAC
jgi:hypothetical protein